MVWCDAVCVFGGVVPFQFRCRFGSFRFGSVRVVSVRFLPFRIGSCRFGSSCVGRCTRTQTRMQRPQTRIHIQNIRTVSRIQSCIDAHTNKTHAGRTLHQPACKLTKTCTEAPTKTWSTHIHQNQRMQTREQRRIHTRYTFFSGPHGGRTAGARQSAR